METALEGCLRGLFYLVFWPFILLGFILQFAGMVVVFVLSTSWRLLRGMAKLATKGASASGSAAGSAAAWTADISAPAAERMAERFIALATTIRSFLVLGLRRAWESLVFAIRWVASAKDDVFREGDHDVNPIALSAKLLTFVAAAGVCCVFVLKAIRGLTHP